MRRFRRTAKNYDGTDVTTHHVSDLLFHKLSTLADLQNDRPDLILLAWPEVLGKQLAPMTEALSFQDGILYVKVKNSTLYSLLIQHEKPRIMNNLKAKFPKIQFRNIVFRIG